MKKLMTATKEQLTKALNYHKGQVASTKGQKDSKFHQHHVEMVKTITKRIKELG